MISIQEAKNKSLETTSALALVLCLLCMYTSIIVFLKFAVVLLIIGLFIKPLAKVISWIWLNLGLFVGEVVSRFLLFISYYLFLTPLAILYRLFNNSNYKEINLNTNFKERRYIFTTKDFEKPW